MVRRYRTIIGLAAIVVFGALGIWSLTTTATPYVGFAKARVYNGDVQVLGKVEHDRTTYDDSAKALVFYIIDENGDRMEVRYSGTRPGNFEQAESVVCVGRYRDGVFYANNLLIKCPSKYEGTEFRKKGAL